jgi:hypothetical protein
VTLGRASPVFFTRATWGLERTHPVIHNSESRKAWPPDEDHDTDTLSKGSIRVTVYNVLRDE